MPKIEAALTNDLLVALGSQGEDCQSLSDAQIGELASRVDEIRDFGKRIIALADFLVVLHKHRNRKSELRLQSTEVLDNLRKGLLAQHEVHASVGRADRPSLTMDLRIISEILEERGKAQLKSV